VQKVKVIPAIDIMENNVVRLVKGNPTNKTIYSDNPVETAKKWEKAGADILHVVDLDATLGRGSNLHLIEKIAEEVSIPIQVAGGLRTEDMIGKVLHFASKAVLGTIAFKNKEVLQNISKNFGKDRIIISVDQLRGKIVISGWTEDTGVELISGIENFVKLGYSEFLLTSVDRDGTLEGPDLNSLNNACRIQNAKIIASGGISSLQDTINVKKCGASAVILGKALYEGKISIEKVKDSV
jgi:phosphoribosylformimino-5-aminoimidazole carboxamide ribotide isomerase